MPTASFSSSAPTKTWKTPTSGAAKHAPQTAARWLDRFQATINTLSAQPERCSHAKENSKVHVELRELHFGRRPNVFRVIFTVEGQTVRVLRIRRAQRRPLTRLEIDEATD
ncbi:MAG: type II toxin-antitoxin system RelE/ParE family toxin [Planctomycetota bacterium]